jgi:uncharacterized protein (TIGR02145 family)
MMKQTIIYFFMLIALFTSCDKEKNEVKPLEYSSVTDVDGNKYKTVKIGNQWWMCENLKVAHYNDGSAINLIDISVLDSWSNTTEGSYCFINDSIYGKLYNYYAVADSRKLAPSGWHIPSDEEWQTMEKYIGMSDTEVSNFAWRGTNQAEKLVIKSSVGWPAASLLFGTNEVGFSALPGGVRVIDGSTNTSQTTAFWWTSILESNKAYYRYIDFQHKKIFRQSTYPEYGMSVRCVKD